MTNYTLLDHSSAAALAADLKRYIRPSRALVSLVYYTHADPKATSTAPWTLIDVGRHCDKLPHGWNKPQHQGPFSIWIRTIPLSCNHHDDAYYFLCEGFGVPGGPFLSNSEQSGTTFTPFRVAVLRNNHAADADDALRRKLNKNLRGVFS